MHTRSFLAAIALLLAALGCRDNTGPADEHASANLAALSESAVAANSWIARANMPGDAYGLTSAVVPNTAGQSILYAIGGRAPVPDAPRVADVRAYNVATNTWTSRAPLPVALAYTNAAGVIAGKIYVSGGLGPTSWIRSDLYVYDPGKNAWTRKRDMPNTTSSGVTGVINGKLYVLTGCRDADYCWTYDRVAFYRYDPATDQWTKLPEPVNQNPSDMGGVIRGKLYVVSRVWGSDRGGLEVYDPVTNRWTRRARLPQERGSGASAVLGGRLYVMGGRSNFPDGTAGAVRTTSVYDPASNTWGTRAPLPTARSSITGARVVVDGKPRIEVIGGSRPGNNLQYIP
jgi:N-acetylneuraminic acid mutarotase